MNAAAEHFGSQGYSETSLADVAARVDLTPKALYYYYSSKHALLEAVLQRAFRYFDEEPLAEAREQWRDLPLRRRWSRAPSRQCGRCSAPATS